MLSRLLVSLVIGSFLAPSVNAQDSPQLDRFKLLQFQKSANEVAPVETAAQWSIRREAILLGMQQVMGKYPGTQERLDPSIEVVEEADAGTYIRRLITYQSEAEPGADGRTPAYLCIPKDVLAGKRKAAAVLCLHPTDNTVGHKVVVGLGGRAGRQYATELAERGYVTISPAYPHLANYWPNLGKLGYVSGTMKAIQDNSRALDLLETLDYVDTSKGFAAIGHSLGGHNAIYTAVFDQRISVIVSSCGFDSYRDYYGGAERVWFFGKGWCQIRYMPRLSDYRGRLNEIPYDFPELLGALAPRPIFVNAPLHDSNFVAASVDRCADAARPVYKLLGDDKNLVIRHPDSDHNFPDAMRQEAYQLIDSVLRP
ncbi:MAG: alpha/beta hydrolase [Planctomycetota bacterium]|nr:alpha/beta hydrolase [Planctomycetota bacterium]MDA0920396.1 alpha/beta hydrolase [Planctomycetota bacterium]MDA1159511.1 alpha/beta hydrolase [Planctomycetota bacterium]